MRTRTKLGLSALSLATLATGSLLAPAATADTSAQGNDAVIVGSDTVQFASNFVADGDANGDVGYNSGAFNRVFDYFATGDANGRFTVAGGVSGSPGSAAETVILRAGTRPVLRPNGSGAGVAALIADSPGSGGTTGYDGLSFNSINLVRMSRLPKTSATANEDASCDKITACGGLHVYEIADDTLGLAALASGSNAVGLDANQLWNIYNCTSGYTTWSSPMIGGSSSDTILPAIPQSGSGTRTFFLATIDAASGHTSDPSLSPTCVRTVQEHDPTGITGATNPADAIEPFSKARLTLINTQSTSPAPTSAPYTSYFSNTSTVAGTPATGYAPGTLALITGNSLVDTTTPTFSTVRAVYLVARQADVNGTCSATSTPSCFVPGGTKNAVQTLISGGKSSAFRSSAFAADIVAAGFTAKFQDCGVDPDDSSSSTNVCVTNP